MEMKHKLLFVLVVAVAAVSSCKSQFELLCASSDTDKKYDEAFNYYNVGKYEKAIRLFESLKLECQNTPREDTVEFYKGMSNYKFKDYLTAETNFQNFAISFPRSPFTESARFLRIDCLYRSTYRYELDQKPSTATLSAIAEYLTDYPDTPHLEECQAIIDDLSERMDRKAYEAAKLYYKMEDYQAAHVALKNVLKDDSENIYREEVLYYTCMSSYKYAFLSVPEKQKERYLEFVDDYYNFIGEYPESEHNKELKLLYRRALKALDRYTGSDEELEEKTKEFERDLKRISKK